MYHNRFLLVLSLALFFILGVPGVFLAVGAIIFPSLGKPTFTILQFLEDPTTASILSNTMIFSLGAAIVAVGMATIYTWFVARTDIPGRRILELMPFIGLSMPLVVKAYAWTFLFDPHVGLLNRLSALLLGRLAPSFNIYSMGGMIFAQAMGSLPIAYLILMPAMRSLDSSMEEASQIAGSSRLATLLRITMPLIFPAILSVLVLLILGGINNFDYAYVLGQPANIRVLATEVYYWTSERSPPSYGSAGIVGILYFLIAFLGVSLYIWLTRRSFKYVTVSGKSTETKESLGRWKYVGLSVCLAIISISSLLPLSTLAILSTTYIYAVGNTVEIVFHGLGYFAQATSITLFYSSLWSTIELGLAAAALGTFVSVLMSYSAYKTSGRASRLTEYITNIPLAFPGIVYGIALLWTFLLLPGLNLFYGTIIPMILALAFIKLPQATRIVSGNLIHLSNEFEEASQISGASFTRTFRTIWLPLLKHSVIYVYAYTFIDALKELGAVILLVTPTTLVFTTLILTYNGSHALGENVTAAASIILVSIVALALVVLSVIGRYWLPERRG